MCRLKGRCFDSMGDADADAAWAALQRFLEGLLEAYAASVEERSAARAVLLAAAAAELLQVHALLAEHAVALGYVDKLLKTLQARVPSQEGLQDILLALWDMT